MKLKCNFCTRSRKTDNLYLLTVGDGDKLVCKYHLEQGAKRNDNRDKKPEKAK